MALVRAGGVANAAPLTNTLTIGAPVRAVPSPNAAPLCAATSANAAPSTAGLTKPAPPKEQVTTKQVSDVVNDTLAGKAVKEVATKQKRPTAAEARKIDMKKKVDTKVRQERNILVLKRYNQEKDKKMKQNSGKDTVHSATAHTTKDEQVPTLDDAEAIVQILGHKQTKKGGKQLRVKWDNGYVGWHPSCTVHLDAGDLVEEYVRRMHLGPAWVKQEASRPKRKLPTLDDAEEIIGILSHKQTKKGGKELKVEWDNGYVGWHPFDTVHLDAGDLVEQYLKEKNIAGHWLN